jgi:hypothetical protein
MSRVCDSSDRSRSTVRRRLRQGAKPMRKMTMNAVMDRVQGEHPSPPRAAAVAASAGLATAIVVYRVLRHEFESE